MNNLKILVLFVLVSLTTLSAETAKVVYDLTSGDSVKINKHLINSIRGLSHYYKEEKIEFKVIVVISGNAYKYFIDDLKNSPYANEENIYEVQKKFKHRLKVLNENGVTFNMCESGMQARNINKESLYKYVHADVMKSVYLIGAQNDGYAYMPIH
jgi:intracellular sulfur oxidation DsrE/DsrF family protein